MEAIVMETLRGIVEESVTTADEEAKQPEEDLSFQAIRYIKSISETSSVKLDVNNNNVEPSPRSTHRAKQPPPPPLRELTNEPEAVSWRSKLRKRKTSDSSFLANKENEPPAVAAASTRKRPRKEPLKSRKAKQNEPERSVVAEMDLSQIEPVPQEPAAEEVESVEPSVDNSDQLLLLAEAAEVEMTLRMTCHSDDSYDLNNNEAGGAAHKQYVEVTEPSSSGGPRLVDFIITPSVSVKPMIFYNPLLAPYNPTSECAALLENYRLFTRQSTEFNDDTFRLNGLDDDDDLGLTVCRMADPDQDPATFTSPLLIKIAEEDTSDHNSPKSTPDFAADEYTNELDDEATPVLPEKKPRSAKVKRESEPRGKFASENEEISFAIETARAIFGAQMLRNGIFADSSGKTRSKTRFPLDLDKTEQLKGAIAEKFKFSAEKMEDVWHFIRSEINKRITKKRSP